MLLLEGWKHSTFNGRHTWKELNFAFSAITLIFSAWTVCQRLCLSSRCYFQFRPTRFDRSCSFIPSPLRKWAVSSLEVYLGDFHCLFCSGTCQIAIQVVRFSLRNFWVFRSPRNCRPWSRTSHLFTLQAGQSWIQQLWFFFLVSAALRMLLSRNLAHTQLMAVIE